MITIEEYFDGRDKEHADELTEEIISNAEDTVDKVNWLLDESGFEHIDRLNSGWRPQSINQATRNAAPGSKHLTAQAADIRDADRHLAHWCVLNLDVLAEIGLWMEDPRWTPSWVHVQTIPPKSRKRVYIPSTQPPLDPDGWEVTWA